MIPLIVIQVHFPYFRIVLYFRKVPRKAHVTQLYSGKPRKVRRSGREVLPSAPTLTLNLHNTLREQTMFLLALQNVPPLCGKDGYWQHKG